MTDYGASNAGLLEHVDSALTLVTIVMNRTIVFQCSSNVNSDSIQFPCYREILGFHVLVGQTCAKKSHEFRDTECSREIMANVLLLCAHVIPFPIPVT